MEQNVKKTLMIAIIVSATMFMANAIYAQTAQERQQALIEREQERQQAAQERQQVMPERQQELQQAVQERQQAMLKRQQELQQAAQERQQAMLKRQQVLQQAAQEQRQAMIESQQVLQQAAQEQRLAMLEMVAAIQEQTVLSKYDIEIKKEYPVGYAPSLTINNMFGDIRIVEVDNDKIVFNIKITGKGKDKDEAKKNAEAVEVNFNQSGNNVSAKTVFKDIQCNNCGRNVNYEVTVPKNTKLILENKYGDIKMNNAIEPLDINLQFGKLFANELTDVNLSIQYGGATINKCRELKIKSSFSKHELGVVETMTGSISYDGLKIDDIGNATIKSDFSNLDIVKIRQSFDAEKFSYGSLKIRQVDENFSNIKIDASFTSVKVALTDKHNFKTTLYSSFGSIKTGNVVLLEKSLEKKDVVVGIAGKLKDPHATVEISNSYGNIVFE